jgi:hypothetical protein
VFVFYLGFGIKIIVATVAEYYFNKKASPGMKKPLFTNPSMNKKPHG